MKNNKGIALIHLIIIIVVLFIILGGTVVYSILGGTIKISQGKTKSYNQQFFSNRIISYKKISNAKVKFKSDIIDADIYIKKKKCSIIANVSGSVMKCFVDEDKNSVILCLEDYKYAYKSTVDEIMKEGGKAEDLSIDDNIFIAPLKKTSEDYKFKYIGTELVNSRNTLNFEMEISNYSNDFKEYITTEVSKDSKFVIKYWVNNKNYKIVRMIYGIKTDDKFKELGRLDVEEGVVDNSQVEAPSLSGYRIIK